MRVCSFYARVHGHTVVLEKFLDEMQSLECWLHKTFPLGDEVEVHSKVVLGKTAEQPVELQTPILNAAMSYGALSKETKMALALGADGVYMAGALKIALGCTYLRQCHLGNCPYGIATQDGKLRKRLDVQQAGKASCRSGK
jgi:glutamate synthase domain-containing protein 2